MRSWQSVTAAISGRRSIVALGLVYLLFAASYPYLPFIEDRSAEVWTVLGILVGGPGLVLLYGGYRLPRTDVHPEFYPAVSTWCLRGVMVGLGIMVPIVLASGDSNTVGNALLLTALGSLAGFAAGSYDARAKTRTRQLQETIEQLETSNERLEQFAYAASHDLQEPLRMVSSYLQLIESRYAEELDEDGEEFIEFAVDGAERMREMIHGLLQYSRVDAQGEPFEPVDLDGVLETALEDLVVKIEEHDAEITAESLPTIEGDQEQLRQVFQNLVSNAIEYRGDEPPRVHVSARREEEKWIVSVRDEGIGIDPGESDRIFEVFQRLHSREEYRGTGIGLALCQRIVERHGGEIWVESQPGRGSTFSFTLTAVNGAEHDRDE